MRDTTGRPTSPSCSPRSSKRAKYSIGSIIAGLDSATTSGRLGAPREESEEDLSDAESKCNPQNGSPSSVDVVSLDFCNNENKSAHSVEKISLKGDKEMSEIVTDARSNNNGLSNSLNKYPMFSTNSVLSSNAFKSHSTKPSIPLRINDVNSNELCENKQSLKRCDINTLHQVYISKVEDEEDRPISNESRKMESPQDRSQLPSGSIRVTSGLTKSDKPISSSDQQNDPTVTDPTSPVTAVTMENISNVELAPENVYESAAKLLFLGVKWARSIPSFMQVR